jgi:hypothetical protein
MTASESARKNVLPAGIWTRIRCGGPTCRFVREHPGQPLPTDLDQCQLCGSPIVGAVTVYRISERIG